MAASRKPSTPPIDPESMRAHAGDAARLLKALGAPIPDVQFCPTGGVSPENLKDFLKLPNVAMAGGSWLTPAEALAAGDWERITQLARGATELAAG